MTPRHDDSNQPIATRVATLRVEMDRMLDIMDGRAGEVGLKDKVSEFITWSKTRDEEKKIYEARISRRLSLAITLAMLILGILTYIMTQRDKTGHSMLSIDSNAIYTAEFNATAK